MTTETAPRAAWGRRRLVGVLAAGAATATLLAAGLVATVRGSDSARSGVSLARAADRAGPATPVTTRDQIAAAPMPRVDTSDARPAAPADTPAAPFVVPGPTQPGPAGVPTGYPYTPAGAVGQLAALDATVLTTMTVPAARDVHATWALPGAPPAGDWVMTENVSAFTTATSGKGGGVPVVTVTPVGAQVKGVDGPDWVLACVLLRVDAEAVARASIAYGHCERMAWAGGRWQVAPGAQPARAPSTWPGTQAFVDAGWRPWAEQEVE